MTDIASVVRILVLLLLIALTVIIVTKRLAVPYTLGLVVVGLLMSFFGQFSAIHLTPNLVLFVFLPALLFEGSWSIEVARLRTNWRTIFVLAVPGLLLSLLLIALPLYFFAGLRWSEALLLGAILSPTDPVAVLGLFRQLKVNADLSSIIEGESLFNDGMAGSLYQIFLVVVLYSVQGQAVDGLHLWINGIGMFLLEAGGGIALGLICGFVISHIVRFLEDPLIETTITIVSAYGVYLIADTLHTSAILAVIFTALLLGSYGRRMGMSEPTRESVDNFWSMIAFVANALLFLLVGIQLNPLHFFASQNLISFLLTASLAIGIVLLSRLIIVLIIHRIVPPLYGALLLSWRFVIFWSGLRGALSMALVLALPLNIPDRESLIFSTYAVVLFTLLVQGLSLRIILRRMPSVSG